MTVCRWVMLTGAMLLSVSLTLKAAEDRNDGGARAVPSGGMVLFDAASDSTDGVRTYPIGRDGDYKAAWSRAARDGSEWIDVRFAGTRGRAAAQIQLPAPGRVIPSLAGSSEVYCGVRLRIHCDETDYPRVLTHVQFSDNTIVVVGLGLEKGTHEYTIDEGFRRANFPPKWELIHDIRFTGEPDEVGQKCQFSLSEVALVKRPYKAPPTAAFGTPVLCPEPKEASWSGGELEAAACTTLELPDSATPRTRRTAELFCEKFYDHTGTRLTMAKPSATAGKPTVRMAIANTATFQGKPVTLQPEGYALSITPEGVSIVGRDEPGLFYGGVTFYQLLRNKMRVRDGSPVPCGEILDWPELSNRMVALHGPNQFAHSPLKEDRGIEFLMDWVDRFVADAKCNVFYVDLSTKVQYRRRPEFNGPELIYSLDDLRRFADYCRDRFVDLCPAWQIGGHANWWLLGYHPELREQGYRLQADLTHPDHDKIVLACMEDVIDALKPKYLTPKGDEYWTGKQEGETPTPLLRGKTRAEAFLDFHVKLNDFLRKRGVQMLLYQDMISPFHNGRRYEIYTIADRLPKDIIINPWGEAARERDIEFFVDKGFPVWPVPTGWFTCPDQFKDRISGYGKTIYHYAPGGALFDNPKYTQYDYGIFRCAEYAWNMSRDGEHSIDELVESGYLIAVRELFAVRPNPHAAEEVAPLDIASSLNGSLAQFVRERKPELRDATEDAIDIKGDVRQVGFIPIQFSQGENDCLLIDQGDKPKSVSVGGKYSSLVFLHTALSPIKDSRTQRRLAPRFNHRQWQYGAPVAKYRVHYADGQTVDCPLRVGTNVYWLDADPLTRATSDNRYVAALKTPDGKEFWAYQWEWINPRPEEPIQQVEIVHEDVLPIQLLLLAVSGREVKP